MKTIKYILLSIAFFSVSSVLAQKGDYFNYLDYAHTINKDDYKITFKVTDKSINDANIDAKKEYFWYSANKIMKTQGGFSGKLLNGDYNEFYLTKNLKEQGTFKLGLKNGLWNKWSTSGKLLYQANYKDGLLHGVYFQYDTLGNLKEENSYRNGLLNGISKKYVSKDNILTTKYDDGAIKPKKEGKFSIWLKKLFKKGNKSKK